MLGLDFAVFDVLNRGQSYATAILPGVLLLGFGMTLTVAPLTTTIMSLIGEGQTGIASEFNNAISRLSGLVAISVVVPALSHCFKGLCTIAA